MVSKVGGPVYTYTNDVDASNKPAPRVKPEAQEFALKGQGSIGLLLQIEGQSFGPSRTTKKKPEPRDHIQENVRRMRRVQRDARKKAEESNKPVKAMWKSSKFDSATSKVKEALLSEPTAPRPFSASYLRAHSRPGSALPTRPQSARPAVTNPQRVEDKTTVPKAVSAREVKMLRKDLNFISVNGRACKTASMRRSPSLTALDDLKKKKEDEEQNYKRGVIPKYLLDRQKSWRREEDERIASIPDPEQPDGHHLMPDADRRETLEQLQTAHKNLMSQLLTLPIRTDTFRMRSRKEEMESRLAELDEAIKIFSRTKVFVKDED